MPRAARKALVIAIAALCAAPAMAQSIDSLQHVLDTAKDESKVKTLNELFRANMTGDPVKALGYSREA